MLLGWVRDSLIGVRGSDRECDDEMGDECAVSAIDALVDGNRELSGGGSVPRAPVLAADEE